MNLQTKDGIHPISLPVEVVTYIMKFLPHQDRACAREVCHLWYEASVHPRFVNGEKVVFNRMLLEDDATLALRLLEKSCRSYLHFVFKDLELGSKMYKFWLKHGPTIKSLTIQSCDVTERMLVEILSSCERLEALELNNCREPLISGRLLEDTNDMDRVSKTFTNLKKLSLCCNRYLSDALFNRFTRLSTNIQSLNLAGCQISFHPGLYKKFYPNKLKSMDSNYASETVLTFGNIMQFIQNCSNSLLHLDLSGTFINSKSLTQIAEIPKLKLKELYLQNCEQLNNSGVLSMIQHQHPLEVLDLSNCSRVTDQSLVTIANNLVQLKKLRVSNCRAITDLGVVELCKLTNLENLDLSQCDQVSGSGLEKALCSTENSKLKCLELRALNKITTSTIISLAEHLTNLLYLDLSFCFNSVTDKSIQSIFKNLIWLRSLKLAKCEALTDSGLTGKRMVNAEYVETDDSESSPHKHFISLRSRAEEEIVQDAKRKKAVKRMCANEADDQESYTLSQLKGLQELDLQSCNKITDVSLEYAVKLSELQHLNLSRCQQITDVGLTFIAKNNPSIHTLNLSFCHNISDEGIKVLAISLYRLKYIDLQGCKQLTNESLLAIKAYCPGLRYLDVTFSNMTPDAVDMLSMAALQTLNVSQPVT